MTFALVDLRGNRIESFSRVNSSRVDSRYFEQFRALRSTPRSRSFAQRREHWHTCVPPPPVARLRTASDDMFSNSQRQQRSVVAVDSRDERRRRERIRIDGVNRRKSTCSAGVVHSRSRGARGGERRRGRGSGRLRAAALIEGGYTCERGAHLVSVFTCVCESYAPPCRSGETEASVSTGSC